MQETQKKKIQITATDRKIVVSIAICYITAKRTCWGLCLHMRAQNLRLFRK